MKPKTFLAVRERLKNFLVSHCGVLIAFRGFLLINLIALAGCNRTAPLPAPTAAPVPAAIPVTEPLAESTTGNSSEAVSPNPTEAVNENAIPTPAESTSADGEVVDAEQANTAKAADKIPDGSWTKQRLIGLSSKGPVVIDLMLRVGGLDLDAANAASIQPIQEHLLSQLGEVAKWETLLELPLVKSGWLGNLIAEEDQAAQLYGMYDKNKDATVQANELTEFLTRGLSRSQPISLSDVGTEPNPDTSNSPFGALDTDADNVLSTEEIRQGSSVLAKLDFNSDSSISIGELAPMSAAPTMVSSRMGRSMLQTNSLVFHQPALSTDEKSDRKQLQRKTVEMLEHYSFLGLIERQQWSGWSDSQWAKLDQNKDGQLDKSELVAIFSVEPSIKIAVDLPSPQASEDQPRLLCVADTSLNWSSDKSSGQFHNSQCDLLLTLENVFSSKLKTQLKNLLTEAFKNPQVKQFLIQQLQVKENALDVVDGDGDQSISEAELASVWNWLVARQTARIQARWMVAARPWFQLMDNDRNQSISEAELHRLPDVFGKADVNQDGLVDANEMPLVVKLQLSRQDQRLELRALQTPENSTSGGKVDADWFAAMDTNRDGSISRSEFLGSYSEFQALDQDTNGFISQTEVY